MKITPEILEHIVGVLNEIKEKDPTVLRALINYRLPCNLEIANHPTIQVGEVRTGHEVGFLGILNGILGDPEEKIGPIVMDADAGGYGHINTFYVSKPFKGPGGQNGTD